jgi:TetR/AcrR family acrAB operon transcriptional repressor
MKRTKADAAQTRSAVIAAAAQIFFEKGVSNTTLEEVARAAGVTRGAIYWHFNSKSDLFLELYNATPLPGINIALAIDSDLDGNDVLMAIENMACGWLEDLATNLHRQRLVTILLRTNFTEEFQPVLQAFENFDADHTVKMQEIFELAVGKDCLSPGWTPQSATRAVKGLVKGMLWEWLLFGKKFDLAREGVATMQDLFRSFR